MISIKKRIFKKSAAAALALAMLVSAVPVPVMAATNYKEYDIYVERPASEASSQNYHGAKYEPATGCYLGMFAEGDSGMHNWMVGGAENWYFGGTPRVTGKDHAAYMLYVQYGNADAISHYASHFRAAAQYGKAIQICLEPGNGLDEVANDDHLVSLAKQANDAGIPIFLRFANEFNERSNQWYGDPKKYIEKYRIVANAFHTYAPNVAMVWAPNDWPIGNEHDYYPGDTYVDWVGVSSYPIYNSNGSPKQGNTWVDRFREIYDTYGSRKPIMLSEGAPSATVEYHTDQDVSASAAYEIERFYASIARRYPNVKLMFYWSENENGGRRIQCELTKNQSLLTAYKNAISDKYYLGEFNSQSDICYRKASEVLLNGGSEKLSCYVNDVNNKVSKVVYYADGNYVGGGYFPDYTANVNLTAYAGKTIKLKADFYNEQNKYVTSRTITAKVGISPSTAKVVVNDGLVSFEAYNIGGNNYFKLRDLAMALNGSEKNFQVAWDAQANAIGLTSKTSYTPVGGELAASNGVGKQCLSSSARVLVDGREVSLKAYNIGGNNYFKLRDVCSQFDIGVTWDAASSTIGIDTSIGYME